ncbi:MAG TPA: MFS transporter, partial [Acidimicrobiales bacterium]|nr:MFS transporter [Acidimicrobiales bacterium]
MASPRRSRTKARTPLPPGFGALWSTVALDLVGFGMVIPILGVYATDFGASGFEVGLLVAAYSAAQFLFSPVWGRLSDRIGRRPVLVISLVGSALGSLLTGLAPTLIWLYLGRIVDGASGASVAVAQASATDLADESERPRLMGLLGAAFALGFVLGPALGGLAG